MVKSRKQSRRQKQRSRKQQRRTRKGRRSCKAVHANRQSFGQRGGMAAIAHGNSLLLDGAARTEAGVGALDGYFADLPKGIQLGGRRRKQRSHRQKKSQRKQRSRRQRGGMAPFGWTGMTKLEGVNPQFSQEGVVNAYYDEFKGPQA